jgi:hypothetical protein
LLLLLLMLLRAMLLLFPFRLLLWCPQLLLQLLLQLL